MKASREERCARMGHSDRDSSYWASYCNTTSTIDFQGLRLGIEEESVERISSAFLGRTAQPPGRVSATGIQLVHQDPELIELLEKQCVLSDQIIEKYGSLTSADASDSNLLGEYRRTKESYVKREGHLLTKRFKIEWKEFFENGGAASQGIQETTVSIPEAGILNDLIDAAERDEEVFANIDPALFAEDENEAKKSAKALLSDLEASNAVQIDGPESKEATIPSTTSLSVEAKSRNTFRARPIARHSLLSDLSSLLYNQPPDLTETQFADTCVTKFNHLHPADRYYPNQEPLPGTMDCRFCGISLLEIIHENEHITLCEGRSLAQAIMDEFKKKETESPPSKTCSMAQSDTTRKRCTYMYKSNKSPRSHRSHAYNAHRDGQSKGLVCHDHSTVFRNVHDFRVHLVMLHSAPSNIIALESSLGEINPEVLVFWCMFCQVWIPRTESSEDEHFPSHIGDVDSAIVSHGFAGVYHAYRWQHPAFCIFCLFDEQAGLSSQFRGFADQRSFLQHVERHLQAMDAEEHMVCPAASATANGIPAQCAEIEALEKECLAKHLLDAHSLLVDASKFVKEKNSNGERVNKQQKRSALGDRAANQTRTIAGGHYGDCLKV